MQEMSCTKHESLFQNTFSLEVLYCCLTPKEVVQQQGRGAPCTFNSEFQHFSSKQDAASAQAQTRFNADDRRFPRKAYEDRNLLWRGTQWRRWDADERAQAMGLPGSIVSPMLQADRPHCRQAAMSTAVGNSFPVPSLMAMFMMLFQLLTPAIEQEKTTPHSMKALVL